MAHNSKWGRRHGGPRPPGGKCAARAKGERLLGSVSALDIVRKVEEQPGFVLIKCRKVSFCM